MVSLKKYHYLYLIVVSISVSACIKFEDPPLSEPNAPINYASPCTIELSDNEANSRSSSGSVIVEYNFSNPSCTDTEVDCNPGIGSFEIVLSEPLTQSRTYLLVFPFVEEGEAMIKLRTSDFFTAPTYYSTSGVLYVEVDAEGSVIIEWCDISCQTTSSSSNIFTSGRVVCN